jgi:hypothetical protein
MAVQFGIGTMKFGGTEIGCLQNVSIDFSFDVAQLYCGAGLFPVDVRTHTGTISGTAEFAELNAVAFNRILGGGIAGSVLTQTNMNKPDTFELELELITDAITFLITLKKCRSSQLSIPMSRDSHVIPSFQFQSEAATDGVVFTIDVGDVS